MSGVDIDPVADAAPGRTPTYSRRRLAGRCGQPGSATVYGAAGHHRRRRCGLGWWVRCGGGWGWLVGRGLDGEVLAVLVDKRGPHVGDVGVLGDVVAHERLQVAGVGHGHLDQEVVAARDHEQGQGLGAADESRKPSTAVRVLGWRRTAMRAWTWQLSGSRLTPA